VAQRDIDDCIVIADSTVGNTHPAARAATGAGVGAAVGAAVGSVVGAIRGNPGSGAAIGAGGGGTGGLARGILKSRKNDPVFQRFVERCLRDRGYVTIGWR
ncbi:MAG: glycine zipper family protein, partial [Myxococcota bacterium]